VAAGSGSPQSLAPARVAPTVLARFPICKGPSRFSFRVRTLFTCGEAIHAEGREGEATWVHLNKCGWLHIFSLASVLNVRRCFTPMAAAVGAAPRSPQGSRCHLSGRQCADFAGVVSDFSRWLGRRGIRRIFLKTLWWREHEPQRVTSDPIGKPFGHARILKSRYGTTRDETDRCVRKAPSLTASSARCCAGAAV
jgi:hypothetical protein